MLRRTHQARRRILPTFPQTSCLLTSSTTTSFSSSSSSFGSSLSSTIKSSPTSSSSSSSSLLLLPQLTTSKRFLSPITKGDLSDAALGIDPAKISTANVVSHVWPNLWPRDDPKMKLRVLTAVGLVFISKIFSIAVPFYFKGIVDGLHASGAASGVAIGTLTNVNAVMGGASSVGTQSALYMVSTTIGTSVGAFLIAYGICRACSIIATEARWAVFAKVSSTAYSKSYQNLFQKFHALDYKFHTAKHTGGLMRNMDRGSRAFESLTWVTIFVLIPTIFESSLVCFLLQQQVGGIFTLTAVAAVAFYIAWTQAMTVYRARLREEYNKLETHTNAALHDSMLNIECVKLYNGEEFERRRIVDAVKKQQELQIKLETSMALLNFGQQLAFIAAAGANFHLGAAGVLAGELTVGDLVLIDSLFVMLYTPLSMLGIWFREFSSAIVNTKTAVSMLEATSGVANKPDAVEMKSSQEDPKQDGTIELKNVSYAFHTGRKVLDNVSLTIPGGSFVGLVAPSGAGKSSLLRLVFRFFDVDSGSILIDGQDIRDVSLDSLRRRFAVIPQDTVLFNETVRYNIAYGRAGDLTPSSSSSASAASTVESVTDAEIEEAAKSAHIHDALAKFPQGYETVVGERGLRLSGGERQRLSIARALLKRDADIVLADEATSALDSMTEAEVVKKLRAKSSGAGGGGEGGNDKKKKQEKKKKRTLVCVAHRLSTLKDCDIIFVLNTNGKLQEQGTHDQLVEMKDGLYAQLWQKQQKKQQTQVGDEVADDVEITTSTSTV